MSQDLHLDGGRARAKVWAALTLSLVVTTAGAITIASAQGNTHFDSKSKSCSSSGACLTYTNGSSGQAIEGNGANGDGLYGFSQGGYGVIGQSEGEFAGVGGYSSDATAGASGVYGQSANGFGVYGYTQSGSGYGVVSIGNALVEGLIYTSGDCEDGCSKTRHQASFAARTSQPTIDDMGEATLRNGYAHVALAGDYANAIDTHKPYLVTLTPEGDASLYIANRSASGFDVREVGGGRATVSFAYRIAGKPYGVRDERLPFKTLADPATYAQRSVRR